MMLTFSQHHSMEQRMTQAQRVLCQAQMLSMRLELVGAIHGHEKFRPQALCPKCNRSLTTAEIFKGFVDDPNDLNTTCTRCGHRFPPKLVWQELVSAMEVPFFCASQSLARLRGKEVLDPDAFRREDPALYHSTIVHHGTLRNAFTSIGIIYGFPEVVDIEKKIRPFLGKLPDTMIAKITGLRVSQVRGLRKKEHISPCTRRDILKAAKEAQDAETEEVASATAVANDTVAT